MGLTLKTLPDLGISYAGVAKRSTRAAPSTAYAEWWFAREVGSQYRLDLAIPELKIGIEMHGGAYIRRPGGSIGGAHHTPEGRRRDMRKMRLASKLGWTIGEFDWQDAAEGRVDQWVQECVEKSRQGG